MSEGRSTVALQENSDDHRIFLSKIITGRVDAPLDRTDAGTWTKLAGLADAEGVAPLLYWRFRAGQWPAQLPDPLRQSLTEAYYATVAYNTLLFGALHTILQSYKSENLPVIVLKGAALALDLYHDIGLRPMSDIDLLIQQADLDRAVAIMRRLGYIDQTQDQTPGLHEMADYHIGLIGGPRNLVRVELHWGLVSGSSAWYAAPVDWFWAHTQPWGEDGFAKALTAEACLIYLAGHTMLQHGGSQLILIWLYDIHYLVQSGTICWQDLVTEVRKLNWGGVVQQALLQCQRLFGTELPEGIIESLAVQADPDITRLVEFKQRFGGVRLIYDWYSLMALRGMPRLRYILGMVFPQPAYMRWRYRPHPGWLWPVYYPYRWLRMLIEGVLAVRQGILRAMK